MNKDLSKTIVDEILHYGIKDQKWGVRRYQNPDGTLTPAGKARYNPSGTPKNPKDMTDEELDESIKRLQKENQYKEARKRAYDPLDENPNKKYMDAIRKASAQAGVAGLAAVAVNGMQARVAPEYYSAKAKISYDAGKQGWKSLEPDAKNEVMKRVAGITGVAVASALALSLSRDLLSSNDLTKDQSQEVTSLIEKYTREAKKRRAEVPGAYTNPLYQSMNLDIIDDILMHYGIKGMKKGQRRYQNEDGTLTPAGKIRYGVGDAKSKLISAKEELKKSEKLKDYEAKKEAKRNIKYEKQISKATSKIERKEAISSSKLEKKLMKQAEANKAAAENAAIATDRQRFKRAAIGGLLLAGLIAGGIFLGKTIAKGSGLKTTPASQPSENATKSVADAVSKVTSSGSATTTKTTKTPKSTKPTAPEFTFKFKGYSDIENFDIGKILATQSRKK